MINVKKYISISSYFSSNYFVCSLFSLTCFFTFLYINPTQNILIDALRANTTTLLKTKIDHLSKRPTSQILERNEFSTATGQVNSTNHHTTKEDDDNNEYSIQLVDNLSSIPKGYTSEQRIEWLMHNLPQSKILKSTTKTRSCDDRIQEFLGIKHAVNNITKCKVSIFMIWISTTSLLPKRDMLSLESALKAHPQGCVVLLSKTMDSKQGRKKLEPLLSQGFPLLAVAPDFHLIFNNTPAQQWLERFESGDIDPGVVPIPVYLADLLKLAILHKYGGVYLDTDVIILKDISGVRNSIAAQSVDRKTGKWRRLNNAVLIFDKGHPLLLKFIEDYASNFSGLKWGYNGPYLVSRVVEKVAHEEIFKFEILSPMSFYPVNWKEIKIFYSLPKNENDTSWIKQRLGQINNESYGIHLWNKITSSLKIERGSIIGKLISDHCITCHGVYDL